jgi:hypothetical protein
VDAAGDGDIVADAGVDALRWATLLAAEGAEGGVVPGALLKFEGAQAGVLVSGDLVGSITFDGSVVSSVERDRFLWRLNAEGKTESVSARSLMGDQRGAALMQAQDGVLYELVIGGATQQVQLGTATGTNAPFGELSSLASDTTGFLAQGRDKLALYAGQSGAVVVAGAVAADNLSNLVPLGSGSVRAVGRAGNDLVLAGATKPGAPLPGDNICTVMHADRKGYVLRLKAADLLAASPKVSCVARTTLWATELTIDAVTYAPMMGTLDAEVIVVGRAKGDLYVGKNDIFIDGNSVVTMHDAKIATGEEGGIFVLKLADNGSLVRHKVFPHRSVADDSQTRAARVRRDGSLVLAGWLGGPMDFGGGPLTHNGASDAFIVTLAPDLTHRWSTSFGDAFQQQIRAMEVASDDAIYVSGLVSGTLGLAGLTSPVGQPSGFVAKFVAP